MQPVRPSCRMDDAALERKFIFAGADGARGSTGSRRDQVAATNWHPRDAGTQAERGRVSSWRGFLRNLPTVPAYQHCRRRSRASGTEPWPTYAVRANGQSSWRAAQATRRIFASWGVRHPAL